MKKNEKEMTIIRLRLFPVQQDERSSSSMMMMMMSQCLKVALRAHEKMFSRFVELQLMMNPNRMVLTKKNKLQ